MGWRVGGLDEFVTFTVDGGNFRNELPESPVQTQHLPPGLELAPAISAQAGTVLSLLDGFELRREGEVVELPMSAQRLLAYLALHDKPLQRGYIAGRLWMENAPDRVNANLRSALWRVQRNGLDAIDATSTHLELNHDVVVDIRVATSVARTILDARAPSPDAPLALLGFDLLPDWYEEWLDLERERFHQLRLHALEALCSQMIEQGRFGEAVEVALMAAAGEPIRESAHRALINAFLAEGNVAEAVRHYDRFHRTLVSEMGVPPSEDLVRQMRMVRPSTT